MSGTRCDANAGAGIGGGWIVRSVVKSSSSIHKDSSDARAASLPGCQSNSSALISAREGKWMMSVVAECAT